MRIVEHPILDELDTTKRVTIYCDDTISIFINHNTIRIHAESADIVFPFLSTVDNL